MAETLEMKDLNVDRERQEENHILEDETNLDDDWLKREINARMGEEDTNLTTQDLTIQGPTIQFGGLFGKDILNTKRPQN